MKKVEELSKEELISLVYELFRDGAEVQNCTSREFAERYYDIEYGDD